ncbi:MAG: DEAD/DEAH box helicase family protein [Candidatus Dormibacteraceae bacterium]
MMRAGAHLAPYFNSESGRLRIAIPFLGNGITLGQPTFLLASGDVLDRYVEALVEGVKPELDEARRCGLFTRAPTPGRTVEEALAFWATGIGVPFWPEQRSYASSAIWHA